MAILSSVFFPLAGVPGFHRHCVEQCCDYGVQSSSCIARAKVQAGHSGCILEMSKRGVKCWGETDAKECMFCFWQINCFLAIWIGKIARYDNRGNQNVCFYFPDKAKYFVSSRGKDKRVLIGVFAVVRRSRLHIGPQVSIELCCFPKQVLLRSTCPLCMPPVQFLQFATLPCHTFRTANLCKDISCCSSSLGLLVADFSCSGKGVWFFQKNTPFLYFFFRRPPQTPCLYLPPFL